MKLLIDGDWLCYSLACAFETINPFGDEPLPMFDLAGAKTKMDSNVKKWEEILDAEESIFHFTDWDNFRKKLMPDYKANRKNKPKPVGLALLREYCEKLYDCVSEPRLEADDTLGICATMDKDSAIVSVDKDFLTIPAHIYNPNKQILKKQSRVNAFKSFIYQVMIGDSSDGYKGIKGIGPKKALKFINEHAKNLLNIWEPLVELAVKQGHDEDYLIMQARMAHILQAPDYDWNTKTIRLWEVGHIGEMING
jgi:DNA polymerase-1